MYEPIKYPSWRYHREKTAVIVNDPLEDEALGEGWADSPAAAEQLCSTEQPSASEQPAESSAPQKRGRRKAA